jgi:hypothetical protein
MVRQLIRLCVVLSIFVVARARADETAAPSRWPMHTTATDGADVTIFQPQLEDFQGDMISARAAVAVVQQGEEQPIFGAIWLQSRVATDRTACTVQVLDVAVTKMLFPGAPDISADTISDAVKQVILAQPITLSLDHLLASVEAIHKQTAAAAALQSTPPVIVFRDHPTVKVQYDGTPRLEPAAGAGAIGRVVNTPFFVALDPASHTYFLKGAGHWFSAPDPIGPFAYAAAAPPAIAQLADQSGYVDPQQPIPDGEAKGLEILTATDPTELIWTDGPVQLSTIPGTALLYWRNTDSDVFLDINNQQLYVLLSGRWYTAEGVKGPWSYVAPNDIPADFAKISPDSPKAAVLASVPGTQQAKDAIADTYIPQTAAIDANNFNQPDVQYDGDPDFQAIDGANCSYADNCQCPVILCSGQYYCCYNAVWYQCDHPRGRWDLCHRVPREIYTIPPSCPIYSVRFCYIYGSNGKVVWVGYTPGYLGCYVSGEANVVYGTGYRYSPWFRDHFIPRPATFGFAAQYHPYTGHWGFAFGLASGGGGTWIDAAAKTHPQIAWFGFGGFRPTRPTAAVKIDRTLGDATNAQRMTYDQNIFQRRTDLHLDVPGVVRPPVAHPPAAPVQKPVDFPALNDNNVFVNERGDVYRHTDNGWERRDGDQWRSQPEAKPGQEEEHHENNPPVAEPPRDEPRQEAPRQEAPRQESPAGPPEQDFRAREEGDDRGRVDNPPPAPPPAPAPAPEEPSHSDSGGGRR